MNDAEAKKELAKKFQPCKNKFNPGPIKKEPKSDAVEYQQWSARVKRRDKNKGE